MDGGMLLRSSLFLPLHENPLPTFRVGPQPYDKAGIYMYKLTLPCWKAWLEPVIALARYGRGFTPGVSGWG
jgi:hypothetical protein